MKCKATKKAEENMANDYRAEMAFVVFENDNTSARVQEGDDGGWHRALGDEVEDRCEIIGCGIIGEKPST